MTEQKKLLILGGNALSSEIVLQAKRMKVYTIVTDWYDTRKSPAKLIADKYYDVSIADYPAVLDIIARDKIDGILTGFTDSSLIHYVNIAEQACLPHYISKEQIEQTTDKRNFKQLCRNFGIPVVEEYEINTEHDIESVCIQYPVLLKPVDNSGGRGIKICSNETDLKNNYRESIKYSEKNQVLVERYMDSPEVHLVYVVKEGQVYLATMGDRFTRHVNDDKVIPLPVLYTYPSLYIGLYFEKLHDKIVAMLSSLGVQNGYILIQSFFEKGEFVVYEMGYRLVGSLENKIIDKQSDVDPLSMLIDFSLGNDLGKYNLSTSLRPKSQRVFFSLAILVTKGEIYKIDGIEKALENGCVFSVVVLRPEGDIVDDSQIGTLAQVALRVFGSCSCRSEISTVAKSIYEDIKITNKDGENLITSIVDFEDLV